MVDRQLQDVPRAWRAGWIVEQRPPSVPVATRPGTDPILRDYRASDLRQVVALDQSALKGFMKTRWAIQFKAEYYSLISAYPRGIFVVAEGFGASMLGFAAGYVWPSEFQKHAAAQNQKLRLAAIPALLRRPFSALTLSRESGLAEAEAWSNAPIDPARCELAIVVVDPAAAGRGIGRCLVEEFARRAAQMGAAEIRLTTSASGNNRANRFFRSLGFELVRVLGEGGKHPMNEYRLRRLTS